MKDKILVRIRLPLADCQYDFRLPADTSAGQIAQTLKAMLTAYTTTPLLLQANPTLWIAREGMQLDAGRTLREQGIKDSDLLFLI